MDLVRIAGRVARGPSAHIYVDLDETLVSATKLGRDQRREDRLNSSGYELATVADGTFLVALRPGAREFLTGLRSLGSVSICTSATRAYAEEILSSFGLDSLVDGVLSRENLAGAGAPDGHVVLVDNLPSGAMDVEAKLKAIGAPYVSDRDLWAEDPDAAEAAMDSHYGRHFVQVEEFYGQPDDSGLGAAMSGVRSALA